MTVVIMATISASVKTDASGANNRSTATPATSTTIKTKTSLSIINMTFLFDDQHLYITETRKI